MAPGTTAGVATLPQGNALGPEGEEQRGAAWGLVPSGSPVAARRGSRGLQGLSKPSAGVSKAATPQPLGPGCLLNVQHGVIVRVSFLTPRTKPCVAACLPLSIFLLVPHKGKGSSHPWCNQCFASLRHLSLPSPSRLQQLIPHPHWLITNGSCNFLFKNYILLFPKSTIIPPLSHPIIRTSLSSSFLHGARSRAPNCTCKAPPDSAGDVTAPHHTPGPQAHWGSHDFLCAAGNPPQPAPPPLTANHLCGVRRAPGAILAEGGSVLGPCT